MVIKCFLVLLGKGFDLNVALNTEKKIRERKKELCEICTDCVTQRHKKSLQR